MDRVYWSWLPNLSGRVFEDATDKLAVCSGNVIHTGFCFRILDNPNEGALHTVIVTKESDKVGVVLDIMDAGGLCRLTSKSGIDSVRDLWTSFKEMLDECEYSLPNCRLTELLIETNSIDGPQSLLAEKMLQYAEKNTDVMAKLVTYSFRWTNRHSPFCSPRAECDIMFLYLKVFLDIYKDMFPSEEWCRMVTVVDRRIKKLDVVQRLINCKREHWYGRTTVLLSSAAVAVAMVSAAMTVANVLS